MLWRDEPWPIFSRYNPTGNFVRVYVYGASKSDKGNLDTSRYDIETDQIVLIHSYYRIGNKFSFLYTSIEITKRRYVST